MSKWGCTTMHIYLQYQLKKCTSICKLKTAKLLKLLVGGISEYR